MSKQSYSFVLWAIPRFHRTGPARAVTVTPHDSRNASLSSEPRAREEDKAPAITGNRALRRATGWRYAIS